MSLLSDENLLYIFWLRVNLFRNLKFVWIAGVYNSIVCYPSSNIVLPFFKIISIHIEVTFNTYLYIGNKINFLIWNDFFLQNNKIIFRSFNFITNMFLQILLTSSLFLLKNLCWRDIRSQIFSRVIIGKLVY